MLSEEEKKAIKDIELLSIGDFITWFTTDGIIKMEISAKTVLNLITKLQKENEEKDKQIDLMARAFKQDDVRSVEEIKQYFEKSAKEKGD